MRLPRLLALLCVLTVPALAEEPGASTAAAAASARPIPTPLAVALETLHEDPVFSSAAISVQVVNVRTGEEVYAWGEDRALVPASVMKLLTTAAAFHVLGPSFRFRTYVLHDGTVDAAGVLTGNLYVKGEGDPTMVVERLWKMIGDIKLKGIREIKGDVLFDDSYFADSTLIPGWPSEEDMEAGPTYFAPLGALSLNYNIASIVVRPGAAAGQPAVVEFETPSPVVVLDNQLTTGGRNSRRWYKVERTLDEETGKIATFKLVGSVPAEGEPDTIYRSIADPLGNYVGVFEALAKQQGLKVRGKFRAGRTSEAAALVLQAESLTLSDISAVTIKHSNNFMAEQILRVVGAERLGLPATTAKGVQAITEYLGGLGVPATDYRLINGSGLTRETSIRPSAVNAVLIDMWQNIELGPEFAAALSVAGRDGTLRSRFREDGMQGRVRGKTGTLDGVTCLSGYVRATDRETYAFTFLVNELEGATSRVRRAHERLVVTVAGVAGDVADGASAGAAGETDAP